MLLYITYKLHFTYGKHLSLVLLGYVFYVQKAYK